MTDQNPHTKQQPGRALQITAPGVKSSIEVPENATLNTGDLVGGRFVIVRFLGSSGGGVSYLAEDTSAGGEVVIKVLAMASPDTGAFGQMAETVRLASTIDHRNLTRIIGMGRADDQRAFVAMEFVGEVVVEARRQLSVASVHDLSLRFACRRPPEINVIHRVGADRVRRARGRHREFRLRGPIVHRVPGRRAPAAVPGRAGTRAAVRGCRGRSGSRGRFLRRRPAQEGMSIV